MCNFRKILRAVFHNFCFQLTTYLTVTSRGTSSPLGALGRVCLFSILLSCFRLKLNTVFFLFLPIFLLKLFNTCFTGWNCWVLIGTVGYWLELLGTDWNCWVLIGTVGYCLVLFRTLWYCLEQFRTVWYCLVLFGIHVIRNHALSHQHCNVIAKYQTYLKTFRFIFIINFLETGCPYTDWTKHK